MRFIKKSDGKDIQIGLDVGSYSVKAVAIALSNSKFELLNFSIKPAGDNIIKAIKEAHGELKQTSSSVVTSISGPAVVARYVDMPSMDEEELAGAVRFEAEKVIPYNINEILLDGKKVEDLGENRMRVVIVGAKKDLVETQLKMLNKADLEALILDIDSFAVMNAFLAAGLEKENVCGLLNIGARRTNLNIVKGETTYLSRDIDIGGERITKGIADNLSLPEDQSRKIKEEKLPRFAQLSPEEKNGLEGPLEETLSRLADEVRLSFDFYENQYASSISKVYISGGSAKPEVVASFLKESLGYDTLSWDPLANMALADGLDRQMLSEVRSELAVAVGLGLRRLS